MFCFKVCLIIKNSILIQYNNLFNPLIRSSLCFAYFVCTFKRQTDVEKNLNSYIALTLPRGFNTYYFRFSVACNLEPITFPSTNIHTSLSSFLQAREPKEGHIFFLNIYFIFCFTTFHSSTLQQLLCIYLWKKN